MLCRIVAVIAGSLMSHSVPCRACPDPLDAIWARLGSSSGSAEEHWSICLTKHTQMGGLAPQLLVASIDMYAAGLRLDVCTVVDKATCAALLFTLAMPS